MENMGAICEGEWSSLSGMYSNNEEADFMAQLLGNCCPIPNEVDGSTNLSAFWPSLHGSTMNMAAMAGVNQNFYLSFDFGNASTASCYSSQESYYLSDSNPILSTMSMDFCIGGDANNNTSSYLIEGGDAAADDCSNQEMSDGRNVAEELGLSVNCLQPKMESEIQAAEPVLTEEKKINNPSENSKKRSRKTADHVQKNKRNVRSKKNQKAVSTSTNIDEEDNNNGGHNRPTSSSCCSEDDDSNGGETSSMSSKGKAALNLNGKTRASRGSATDPQSLYARKRRERINERLRILQNLVPNGTKVDISTMLEEAVQYVKFLQLQIKLLSSDDLWMYAPIAYNGMSIGLDLRLATPSL